MNNHPPTDQFVNDLSFTEIKHIPLGNKKQADKILKLSVGLVHGDSDAWSELYLHLGESLVSFIEYIVHSNEDAWDISQDVFTTLWENRHKLKEVKNIQGYIYTLSKFYAYNLIKRRKYGDDYKKMVLDNPLDLDLAPDEIIAAKEIEILVRLALEAMPEKQRRIFEMSRFEGKSQSEIAREYGLTEGSVRNVVYTVTKELKAMIGMFLLLFISEIF